MNTLRLFVTLMIGGLCEAKIWEVPLPKQIQDCYNKVQDADIRTYVGSKLTWVCESMINSQLRQPKQLDAQKISYYKHLMELSIPSNITDGGATVPRRKRQARRRWCLRKEYRTMSDAERTRYHNAINTLKRNTSVTPNKYDAIALFHVTEVGSAHGGAGFFGWHRLYLNMFEAALQEVDPSVCLPYWDCSLDSELENPTLSNIWTPEFMGTPNGPVVHGPFANWRLPNGAPLIRNVDSDGELITATAIEDILSRSRYEDITSSPQAEPRYNVELQHGGAHMSVGGAMTQLDTAAFDPIFFLLHAYIDCIFELFRERLRAIGGNPELYPDLVFPNARHHSSAATGFGSQLQADAYRNVVSEMFEYLPAPECSSRWPECNSRYLTCLVSIGRCVPTTAATAMSSPWDPTIIQIRSRRSEADPLVLLTDPTIAQSPVVTGAQLSESTTTQSPVVTGAQLSDSTTTQSPVVTGAQLSESTTTQSPVVTGAQLSESTTTQSPVVTGAQLSESTTTQSPVVTGAQLSESTTTQSPVVTGAQLSESTTTQSPVVTGAQLSESTTTQSPVVTGAQLSESTTTQSPVVTGAQLSESTTTQSPVVTGAQLPRTTPSDTRCLNPEKSYGQAIQNDFCCDNTCDTNEWVTIPVKIISVRPPKFNNYKSYPVHKGLIDNHYDIYSPRAYNQTNRFITQRRSNPKTYKRCESDHSVGQVLLSSRGINYQGFYEEAAIVDQRQAASISVGFVAVKKPARGAKVSKALIRAHDSCGRVCQAACRDPLTGYFKECKGAIAVSAEKPAMYGKSYDEAVMSVFDYEYDRRLPQFNTNSFFIAFYCDYRSEFPYTNYSSNGVPRPQVAVNPPAVVPPSNTECQVTPQCILDIPCVSPERQCSLHGEKQICRGSCKAYAVCMYGHFFLRVCPEGQSFDNVRKLCVPGGCR